MKRVVMRDGDPALILTTFNTMVATEAKEEKESVVDSQSSKVVFSETWLNMRCAGAHGDGVFSWYESAGI